MPEIAASPSLGVSLLASGIVGRATTRSDPLAPIRRMTQEPKRSRSFPDYPSTIAALQGQATKRGLAMRGFAVLVSAARASAILVTKARGFRPCQAGGKLKAGLRRDFSAGQGRRS